MGNQEGPFVMFLPICLFLAKTLESFTQTDVLEMKRNYWRTHNDISKFGNFIKYIGLQILAWVRIF